MPADSCSRPLPLPDTSDECTFADGGGDVFAEATTAETRLECDSPGGFSCRPYLSGQTSVTLSTSDGTLLASCATGYLLFFYGTTMPACADVAAPAGLAIGTVFVCRGETYGTKTFGCGSARKP